MTDDTDLTPAQLRTREYNRRYAAKYRAEGRRRPSAAQGTPEHCRQLERRRAQYAEDPSPHVERTKAYYLRNAEKVKAKERARPAEAKRAAQKRHRDTNKALYAARFKEWCNANRDKVRAYNAQRRAREMGAEGFHTATDRRALLERYDYRCGKCGSRESPQIDHIVPLAKGGTNWPANLQVLCKSCNCQKKDFNTDAYLPWSEA